MPPKLNFAAAIAASAGGATGTNSNIPADLIPPKTIREFTANGPKQKGIMPKQLSIDRLKMFAKDIDHLTSLLSKRRFGTVLWDTDLPDANTDFAPESPTSPSSSSSSSLRDAASRSPQQNSDGVTCCDVITTPLVINLLTAWLPASLVQQLRTDAKVAMNIASDFQILWIKDVPIRIFYFISDAVHQAFPSPRANTKQGISLFVMLPLVDTQKVLAAFGAAPVPFLSLSENGSSSEYYIQRKTSAQIQQPQQQPSASKKSGGESSSSSKNVADGDGGRDKFVMPLDIVHQQLVYTKGGGNNTFVTVAGMGPAWWDICMVLMQSEPRPIVKLANECALLFQTPRNGQLVTPAEANNVIPQNVFFVTTDITNLLRNVTFDYDNIELPPVQGSQVQFGLVRVRNSAHVERLMAMGKFWYCHDVWRSKMPGLPPRSYCGASYRRFTNENQVNKKIANSIALNHERYSSSADSSFRHRRNNNNNKNVDDGDDGNDDNEKNQDEENEKIIPLILSVDSLQTRMKDDCFSVEVNPVTREIEFTTYIACPLSEADVKTSNLLEGPVISQALERLTSKHDGSRKASMLDDDSTYSFSKVHSGGDPRRGIAVTGIFDMETLRFKEIKKGCPRVVELVVNEELDCGIVRSIEEGNMPMDEFNAQCAVRMDIVDKLFQANRDRAGDENSHYLFPHKSQMIQRIADTQFAREVTGRDEYLFRSVVNTGGTTMSDWTRHLFKLSRFVFSTGLRSQIISNWNLDLEFGSPQFQGPAFKAALQPLIQVLEARASDLDAYVATAAPLWEKFRTGAIEARSPVALELLASSLRTVEGADLLDLIAAATGVLIDVDVTTPILRILDGVSTLEDTLPNVIDASAPSSTKSSMSRQQSQNVIAGSLFANWRGGDAVSGSSNVSGSAGDVLLHVEPNGNSSSTNVANLETLAGAKPLRQFIGPFDVTNETDYQSLLHGTSPLRTGMHTLAHYLALRPPRSNAEKGRLKKAIEAMKDDIIAAQDQRRKDSISNTLSCLFDQQVPVSVKKVMLTGHVSRTSEYHYKEKMLNVYLPKWSCFVAVNVVSPRGANVDIRKIPLLTKVQIVAAVEDPSCVGQLSTDEFTNSIPPLDLGDNNSTLFTSSGSGVINSSSSSSSGAGGLKSPTSQSSRGWRFQAIRSPGGRSNKTASTTVASDEGASPPPSGDVPVWYKTNVHPNMNVLQSPTASMGSGGSGGGTAGSPATPSSSASVNLVSFSLYTDEKQAWKITFPILLGGTVVAGRGHDTALLDRL